MDPGFFIFLLNTPNQNYLLGNKIYNILIAVDKFYDWYIHELVNCPSGRYV